MVCIPVEETHFCALESLSRGVPVAENSTLHFPQNEPKPLGGWTIPREEGSFSETEATPTVTGHCERKTQRQKPEQLPPTCPPLISRGSPLTD